MSVTNLHLAFLLLLVVGYFFLRFFNLDAFPVFVDEAIYIRWSQLIKTEAGLRFVPLQDGKQPLFMWITAGFLKFISDPLVAGRLVSVLSGFGTMIGVGAMAWLVTKRKDLSLWGMLLVLVIPYSLFFDRLALVDSLLGCFGIWSLVLSILMAREKRLDLAMILGIVVGMAMITKSPGMYFLILSPIVVLFYGFDRKNKNSFIRLVGLIIVSVIFSSVIYNILRLGPNFHMIGLRNKDYVWPITEIASHPLDPLIPHLKDVFRYYWEYLTLPVVTLGIIGIFRAIGKDRRNLVLVFWWLAPLLGQSAIAKTFTARYILYGIPLFLVFSLFAIEYLQKKLFRLNKKVFFVLLIGFLLPILRFDFLLLASVDKTPLPKDERKGYLEDWSSGWGIKETANIIRLLPKDIPILVGTEGYFGTLPDGLQIYLNKEPAVSVIGVGYPISSIPNSLLENVAAGNRSFLLVNQSRFLVASQNGLDLIFEYPKPGGDKLLLFELKK
jgi:4-amino-4-deoxy-L-arabinose transferase-like glycosyltransferase